MSPDPVRTGLVSGTVVTAFGKPEVVNDGAVLWQGERILEVGAAAEMTRKHADARWLDARGGLILPGLVNLHHHFYSSLARGLDPERQLDNFGEILDGLWWRLDRALDRDTIRLSAELALADSIRWGATTVFDHHASPSAIGGSLELIAEAVERAGLSAVLCYEITDRNRRRFDRNRKPESRLRRCGSAPVHSAGVRLRARYKNRLVLALLHAALIWFP